MVYAQASLNTLPTTAGLGCLPIVHSILRKPNGDGTAVAQCVAVFGPVRGFIERFLPIRDTRAANQQKKARQFAH